MKYILPLFLFAIFSLPASALAYFGETVSSSDTFSAGTLAFTVSATTTTGTASDTFQFSIDNTGTHTPQYQLSAGSSTCTGTSIITSSSSDAFEGAHTAQISGTPASDCSFSVTVNAWQQGLTQGSGGFTASHTLTFTIDVTEQQTATSTIMLNEIYPNVDSNATSSLKKIEWVELYNPGNAAVDLAGYAISEMAGTNTIKHTIVSTCPTGNGKGTTASPYNSTNTVIPAHGLIVIQFCSENELNNNGDTVGLYNASSTLLDTKTFGSTDKGKSHSRIPDGGTWVDPEPSPGISNMETVTRSDLEAEGWTEEMIDAVLGTQNESSVETASSTATSTEMLDLAISTDPVASSTDAAVSRDTSTSTDDVGTPPSEEPETISTSPVDDQTTPADSNDSTVDNSSNSNDGGDDAAADSGVDTGSSSTSTDGGNTDTSSGSSDSGVTNAE